MTKPNINLQNNEIRVGIKFVKIAELFDIPS